MKEKGSSGRGITRSDFLKLSGATAIGAYALAGSGAVRPATASEHGADGTGFVAIIERERVALTGGPDLDLSDERVRAQIEAIDAEAERLWASMRTEPDRAYLFDTDRDMTDRGQIGNTFRDLREMAIAYASRGSRLEGNARLGRALAGALAWMIENAYNDRAPLVRQWPTNIGIPTAIGDLILLLGDLVSKDEALRYLQPTYRFTPDPQTWWGRGESTGANRVWQAQVVLLRGALSRDAEQVARAAASLSPVLDYVDSGDGFHRDGTFIQHEAYPYNGGYGLALYSLLPHALWLLDGTPWQVRDPDVVNVYEWAELAFEPFMFKGSVMGLVRGRNISRDYAQDHAEGQRLITAVLRLTEAAPPETSRRLRELVKGWIEQDTFLDFLAPRATHQGYNPLFPTYVQKLAIDLLESDVPARGPVPGHRTFTDGDRVVHRTNEWAFGIAMHSTRIRNYECISRENVRGWYTGDGMTYLYDDDLGQYDDGFWATVDPYRLPGVTAPVGPRADGSGAGRLGPYPWAGGTQLDGFGVAGMRLKSWNSSLTAHKSWFMLGDQIVALGAGVSADSDTAAETTVENRKVPDTTTPFIVDGRPVPAGERPVEIGGARWAHLEGVGGYVFPDGADLTTHAESRTGRWSDVNPSKGSSEPVTRDFRTVWIDHGSGPRGASYAYVLLPGRSAEQVTEYAVEPGVEVLENSEKVQAVRAGRLGIVAANFWEDGGGSAGSVSCDGKATVMVRQRGYLLDVAVSDSTQVNDGAIRLELGRSAGSVVSADPRVSVEGLHPTIRLAVDVFGARGQTFSATFDLRGRRG